MNYVEGARKLLDESQDGEGRLKMEAELGESALDVQIAQLKAEVTKANAEVKTKETTYKNSKYAIPFKLNKIDDAEYDLSVAKKKLADLEADLKSREDLKKELFPKKK